jgi:hypothetical protein
MAEFHMRFGRKRVNAYPRDLDIFVRVSDDFLNFRVVSKKLGMTQHALLDGRNSGCITRIRARMAIEAIQAELHVLVVRKQYRLCSEATYKA